MSRPPESVSASDLAVVIPAWNERANLELLLPALKGQLDSLNLRSEIVVVDAGSHDGTREAAERWGARVVLQQKPGYGGALMEGLASTTAPYVVTMDADLSHRPVFIEEFWKRRREADLLIASRYVPGGRADMSLLRRFLSRVLNRTYRRVLSLPLQDLSSGFRMYRRDLLGGLAVQARDFDVLEEILIRVHADGRRILEVPFHYMARGAGRSHARLVKFGWALFKTLLRMWRLRNSVESADYDYRAYDSPIWLQRYWQRTRHRIVLDFVGKRKSVLDVGCGSSRIILDLPDAVGFDIQQNKLRWLSARHRRLTRGTCTVLPFRSGSLDAVINSQVIEHVPEDPAILGEARRVLRPGGLLVLGTPDYGRRLWWVLEWVYGKVLPGAYAHEHITHFTRASLLARLREAGFEVLAYKYVGFCELIVQARKPAGDCE
jgi:dolichol-phosphate mannosyltransferase